MSGLLPRIRRRRAAALDQPDEPLEPAPTDVATVEPPPVVPAGADRTTSDPHRSPGFRERGRLRRRLRHLRRLRELGLRDLGGLVADLDRFGRSRDDLVRSKLDALAAIDDELRTIELALGEDATVEELREAGIAACGSCGALCASDWRFCAACGSPLGPGEARAESAFAVASA